MSARAGARGSGDGEDFLDDAIGGGELQRFERGAVDGGGVEGADTLDGGVEVVEGAFLDHAGDLRGDAAEGFVFVDQDGAVGFSHAGQDGFFVQRTNTAEVDDLG